MRPFLIAIFFSLLAPAAVAAPEATSHDQCFRSANWDGWSAPGDGDAILIQVGVHDVYSLQLSAGTHVRKYQDRILVNQVRGSNWVCTPLDMDLTLTDRHGGFSQHLNVRSIHKLTPDEIAAIPRRDWPG